MNKLLYIAGFTVLTAMIAAGCKKEAALTPSEEEQGYVVPQGNSVFDARIVDFYNKYGKYILYKFSDKDTYWTPSGWKNSKESATGTWNTGYLMTPADTTYITAQLDLVDKQWLSFYTDKFLTNFLPAKIMLCNTLDSVYTKYVFTPTFMATKGTKAVGAWYNYDNICVSYANPDVLTMTPADSINFLAKCNLIFIQSIAGRNLSAPTNDFAAIANYNATISNQATAYANGIITIYYNTRTAQNDWNAYMQAMVSYSETMLNTSTVNTNNTFMGILNATKDTNGKVRQRYNIIRNYFINNYGVDLQAIGNAAHP